MPRGSKFLWGAAAESVLPIVFAVLQLPPPAAAVVPLRVRGIGRRTITTPTGAAATPAATSHLGD